MTPEEEEQAKKAKEREKEKERLKKREELIEELGEDFGIIFDEVDAIHDYAIHNKSEIYKQLKAKEAYGETLRDIYSIYNQKQLTKATKGLMWGTIILAAAAGLQATAVIYGQQVASETVKTLLQIGGVFLVFAAIVAILQILFDVFGKAKKFFHESIKGMNKCFVKERKKRIWVMAGLIVLFVIADVLTTRFALALPGNVEGNKFVAWIISKNLAVPFDIAKVVFVAWIVLPIKYSFQNFMRYILQRYNIKYSVIINRISQYVILFVGLAYYLYLTVNNTKQIFF
jgi:hypothetical protein